MKGDYKMSELFSDFTTLETVEERKNDTYNQIMFNSYLRLEEMEHIYYDISRLTRIKLSEKDKEKIKDVVGWFDVEDGVTVFTISKCPDDKKFIGKVDLGCDNLIFYWGANRNSASRKKYSLGVSVKQKPDSELHEYTELRFKDSFPTLCKDVLLNIHETSQSQVYSMVVYPTAGAMYKSVRTKNGKWLVQTPSEKGQFVPNKGIGLFVSDEATFYMFEPKPKHVVSRPYERCFKIVEE